MRIYTSANNDASTACSAGHSCKLHSYYTIFSLAPLLIIVIAVAGAIFGRDAAQEQIVAQIGGLVGQGGATAVEAMLRAAWD